MQATAIPAYKLTPPLVSSSQVQRTQIVDRIRQARDVRLVLLRAPAGFGKTTVMVQYYAELKAQGIATAWLSLDPADNDLGRFVSDLAAAFHHIDPAIAVMPARTADIDGFALDLLNRIGLIDRRFVLFIDELEVIPNRGIVEFLRRVLLCLPHGATIVAGSRDIPDLGLGRLRAHGALLEIGPASLRFSLDETICLFRDKRHLAVADREIDKLQRCTEGWVAALQLAALSLAGREDHQNFVASFSGSNAAIADYLAEDVLMRQSPEVQEFLLKTSILQQLSPPLCDAVTGRADSQEMLMKLERGNLFLVPLDDERRWYRYHSIFADFLRNHLEQATPGAPADLHRRASEWYAEQKRPVPAIEHAFSSGVKRLMLSLLSQSGEQLLWEGRVRLLTRWMDTLGMDELAPHPTLRLIYAWALCLTHRYHDATTQIDAIGGAAGKDFEGQLMAIQTLVLMMTDRAYDCYQGFDRRMPPMPSSEPFTYGVVANSMALCLIAASEYGAARDLLDKAKHSHARLGGTFSMAVSDSMEGQIDLLQGRLHSAIASLRSAYYRIQTAGSGSLGRHITIGVLLAVALYEADLIAEAEKLLAECLSFVRETGTPDAVIFSYLLLSRIACQREDRARARQTMSELEYLGHQGNMPRMVASAWLERSRIALLEGDVAAAAQYLDNADKPEVWRHFAQFSLHANDIDMVAIARARLMIARGQAQQAIALLEPEIRHAQTLRRHRRWLKLMILLAAARKAAGQQEDALRTLGEALAFAGREGFIRTFVDEGPAVVGLIAEARAALRPQEPALAFIDQLLRSAGQAPEAAPAPAQALTETLTEREIQVLRLLAEGHPNRVLAERLYVTETTIKAHLRNINAKLGARNRTDAIVIARRIGLLGL